MINTTTLLAYILAIILFLGTPGPVTVMVANTSSKAGLKAGFANIAGTNTASLLLITISFLVIQGILAISETALLWLTLFGSLYVLYFAIGILKENVTLPQHQQTTTQHHKHFRDGFIVGISNPKDVLFFIAFFPLFLNMTADKWLSMLLLVAIWTVMDYGILMIYALLFSKIKNPKITNLINKMSGLVLAAVALYASIMTAIKLQISKHLFTI